MDGFRSMLCTYLTVMRWSARAASTAFKQSRKPAAGGLRASWCRPSRPPHPCPRTTRR